MHTKDSLLFNQKTINDALNKIITTKFSGSSAQFAYTSSLLALKTLTEKTLKSKKPKLSVYTPVLDELLRQINVLTGSLSNNQSQPNQLIRLDYLKKLDEVLHKTIEEVPIDKNNQNDANTIFGYQTALALIIKTHFDSSFILPKPLSLIYITKEYTDAYGAQYGQGIFGFFKLPLKLFFQQQTRTQELQFLNDVEQCALRNHRLDESSRDLLRLSAANLISLKISSETFGNGSILAKILKKRIAEALQPNAASSMMENFIDECKRLKINVPQHLSEFYENELVEDKRLQHP